MGRHFYNTSLDSEISMRNEMVRTMDGAFPETSKKQKGLVRIMLRDTANQLVPCACVNTVTHEGDKDHYCPYCLGEGTLWREEYIYFYRWEPGYDTSQALSSSNIIPGNLTVPLRTFYIDYQADLTLQDRVIELMLDKDGVPAKPLRRRAIYRLGVLYDYRLDNGRLEYWKGIGYQDTLLELNTRSY